MHIIKIIMRGKDELKAIYCIRLNRLTHGNNFSNPFIQLAFGFSKWTGFHVGWLVIALVRIFSIENLQCQHVSPQLIPYLPKI